MMKYRGFVYCILFVLCGLAGAPAAAETPLQHSAGAVSVPVSILSPTGAPVRELEASSFRLRVDGKPAPEPVLDSDRTRQLIYVFDRLSLEKKNLKNVLKTMETLIKEKIPEGSRVSIFLGGQNLDLVQGPTADPKLILGALEKVRAAEYLGEKYRGVKRSLTRSVATAQTHQTGAFKASAGNAPAVKSGLGVEDAFGSMQATQYVERVNGLRDEEMSRILQELLNIEMLIRGCGGAPGRRDLIWVGEDLFAVPGMDVYAALWENFQAFRTTINLKMPGMWAEEKNLRPQFETVSQLAQGMGVRVHILDAADRGRYASDRINENKRSSGMDKFGQGDPRNMVMDQTGAESQDLAWGGNILAGDSGGVYFFGSRDPKPFFEHLKALLNGSYLLSFDMPGGTLDGALHELEAEAVGRSSIVKAPKHFAAAHPLSRLTDLANAEAILHLGENNLGFAIEAGESTATKDGRLIQNFRIILPVDRFQFRSENGQGTAHLAIAVVMKDLNKTQNPPKIFELPVSIPESRLENTRKIAASFRLLVDSKLEEIAFAVRDELSGRSGSLSLKMNQ